MLHEARQIGPEPNDAKGSQSDDVQDLVCLPSVHLRPLCVLVAPGGGVAGVRDVLQEAPPVLQVLDADVAAQVDNESTESTQQCVLCNGLTLWAGRSLRAGYRPDPAPRPPGCSCR